MLGKKIVGFGFNQGVGKDTAADYLVSKYGYTKFSLANPLKEAAAIIFSIPIELFYDPILKEEVMPTWGYSPRVLLQKLGTDMLRQNIHNDIWIMNMRARIEQSENTKFVIPDIRFPNECSFILDNDGTLVKIERTMVYSKSSHVSENILNDYEFPFELDNNTSFENLYRQIDILVSHGYI